MANTIGILIVACLAIAQDCGIRNTCLGDLIGGPYEMTTSFAEACPRDEVDNDFPVNIQRIRDRHNPQFFFINMNFTSNFVFDDFKNVHVVFASWNSNGGWKENALVMKFQKVCTTAKTYVPSFWKEVRSHIYSSTNPVVDDCPYGPGEYSIRNVSSALVQPKNMPVMFYGKWRLDSKVIDPNIIHGIMACVRVYVNIIPKQRKHYSSSGGSKAHQDSKTM